MSSSLLFTPASMQVFMTEADQMTHAVTSDSCGVAGATCHSMGFSSLASTITSETCSDGHGNEALCGSSPLTCILWSAAPCSNSADGATRCMGVAVCNDDSNAACKTGEMGLAVDGIPFFCVC